VGGGLDRRPRDFIDALVGDASENTYFEVEAAGLAVGLPERMATSV
jgi:hypothetical protein